MLKDWLSDAMETVDISAAELSRQLTAKLGRSIDRAAVSKMALGRRNISADELHAIEEVVGFSSKGMVRVPVLSMVSASNLRDQPGISEQDINRWIEVGGLRKGDWIALIVDGDSMDRIAPDEATILVNMAETELVNGANYVFANGDGAATFKRYLTDPPRLQPYSTNPDHASVLASDDLFVYGRVRRVIHDL